MGVAVERRFGRAALLECMADRRLRLKKCNLAAAQRSRALRFIGVGSVS
jgi:hypothetical protein